MNLKGFSMRTNNEKQIAKCYNKDWEYVASHKTDIIERFKKLGWTPPSERKQINGR